MNANKYQFAYLVMQILLLRNWTCWANLTVEKLHFSSLLVHSGCLTRNTGSYTLNKLFS